MPPPSRLRMRNGLAGESVAVTVIWLLLCFLAEWFVDDRLDPAAEPDPQHSPGLVEEQPLRDPRHNSVRQGEVRGPLSRLGNVQAQPVSRVDVRESAAVLAQ